MTKLTVKPVIYSDESPKSLQCRRLLFEAGADPTLRGEERYIPDFLEYVLRFGTTVFLTL